MDRASVHVTDDTAHAPDLGAPTMMNTATDSYSIAALSRSAIRTPARPKRVAELMTVDEPLCFELPFANGERLRIELHGSGHEPTSLWRAMNSMKHLAGMSAGWNSYGAQPVQVIAAKRTLMLLALLLDHQTPDPNVIPRTDGGMQLEWHKKGIDVEVVVRPTGPVSYYVADATGEQEWSGAAGRPHVLAALAKLAQANLAQGA